MVDKLIRLRDEKSIVFNYYRMSKMLGAGKSPSKILVLGGSPPDIFSCRHIWRGLELRAEGNGGSPCRQGHQDQEGWVRFSSERQRTKEEEGYRGRNPRADIW